MYKDIEDNNFFVPSFNGFVIKCDYELKVSLYFENFVDYNHRPRITVPISLINKTYQESKQNIGNKEDMNKTNESNNTPKEQNMSEQSTNDGNNIDKENSKEKNEIIENKDVNSNHIE